MKKIKTDINFQGRAVACRKTDPEKLGFKIGTLIYENLQQNIV